MQGPRRFLHRTGLILLPRRIVGGQLKAVLTILLLNLHNRLHSAALRHPIVLPGTEEVFRQVRSGKAAVEGGGRVGAALEGGGVGGVGGGRGGVGVQAVYQSGQQHGGSSCEVQQSVSSINHFLIPRVALAGAV